MTRDLEWLHESLRAIDRVFFGDELAARGVDVRWDRYRPTKHTFRFGAWHAHSKRIVVHPVLANDWAPDYVVLGTLYHEGLHVLHGPKHDARFLYLERRFPFAVEDAEWRADHHAELLTALPPELRRA